MATALGAAAAHAKILADQEEREMEQLAAIIIDQQVGWLVRILIRWEHLGSPSTLYVCCFKS